MTNSISRLHIATATSDKTSDIDVVVVTQPSPGKKK